MSNYKEKIKNLGAFIASIGYDAIIIITLAFLISTFLISPFKVMGHSMDDTLHDQEFIIVDKLSYLIGEVNRGDPIVFLPPAMNINSPKFEIEVQTDHKGKGRLEIQNLENNKLAKRCENKVFSNFGLCSQAPKEGDLVYFALKEDQLSDINPENIGKMTLTEEDIKEGYFHFNAKSNTSYFIKIYDSKSSEYYVKRVIGIPGDTVKIKEGRVYVKKVQSESFEEIDESFLNKNNFHKTLVNKSREEKIFVVPEENYFVMGDNRNFSTDSRAWLEPVTQDPNSFVPKENISGKVKFVLWPFTQMRLVESNEL